MGKAFEYVKRRLVDFKLNMCCWMAPVRVGLLMIGYINVTMAVISLIALSDDSFTPILMQVESSIFEDNPSKPLPVIAYASDLSFSVILLIAIYKKDIPLLRLYQRYCIVAIITSIMVYSLVVAVIGIIVGIALVVSIVFQIYVLVLVRSYIVEVKFEKRNLELPTLVLSSIPENKEQKEKKLNVVSDVEAPSSSSSSDDSDSEDSKSVVDKKDRLETVNEHPKEESSSEEVAKEKK